MIHNRNYGILVMDNGIIGHLLPTIMRKLSCEMSYEILKIAITSFVKDKTIKRLNDKNINQSFCKNDHALP